MEPLLGGHFCIVHTLKNTTSDKKFLPPQENSNLIIKTINYRRFDISGHKKETIIYLLYLSYITYQLLQSYQYSGKKILLAKMFNLPHIDGYMICQKIPYPCHPVHWEKDKQNNLESSSLKKLEQLRDFFEIAVQLALDKKIFVLDLSPRNLQFDNENDLYLIDTLGFPINTSGWFFLYKRLSYWTKKDQQIFNFLTKNFPREVKKKFDKFFSNEKTKETPLLEEP